MIKKIIKEFLDFDIMLAHINCLIPDEHKEYNILVKKISKTLKRNERIKFLNAVKNRITWGDDKYNAIGLALKEIINMRR